MRLGFCYYHNYCVYQVVAGKQEEIITGDTNSNNIQEYSLDIRLTI